MTLEIVRFEGHLVSRATGWIDPEIGERKRRTVQAARDRDAATLWNLTEANLTRAGRAGATVSHYTLARLARSVARDGGDLRVVRAVPLGRIGA